MDMDGNAGQAEQTPPLGPWGFNHLAQPALNLAILET